MITQTFVYICDACGKREESKPVKVYRGDAPMRPDYPLLWMSIEGRLYCDNHEVLLLVDGRPPP